MKALLILLIISSKVFCSEHLYLDLMKKCLTDIIYEPEKLEVREGGNDWPSRAHTMIGLKRLDNLQYCVEHALKNQIPGDLVETGVWRGGATILMRAILEAHQERGRRVWVVDSFEGLPPPEMKNYSQDEGLNWHEHKELIISFEQVQENFKRYGLLDDQVVFLKGWFKDTLPTAPIDQIAVLRLDGDFYGSTMDALTNLYPKLSKGGYVIIDDWILAPCQNAVKDYRALFQIEDEIIQIDWTGVYWQKTN